MQRILVDTQATISITYDVDGTPTDPSPATATVTITNADGTPVITDAPTVRTATGQFAYTLSTAQTAQLNTLTATWSTSLGDLTTTIEIVGGFLFGLAELDTALGGQAGSYSTDRKAAARTLAEQALEDACGVAFVPRYATTTLSGTATTTLLMPYPRVTVVRSATIDGTAVDPSTIIAQPTGLLYNPNRWTFGYGNVTVGFEHGYATPPARVSRACLLLAKRWLIDTPIDDRITSMSTDDGTFSFVTAGVRGAMFDLPEVNAVCQQYGTFLGVA